MARLIATIFVSFLLAACGQTLHEGHDAQYWHNMYQQEQKKAAKAPEAEPAKPQALPVPGATAAAFEGSPCFSFTPVKEKLAQQHQACAAWVKGLEKKIEANNKKLDEARDKAMRRLWDVYPKEMEQFAVFHLKSLYGDFPSVYDEKQRFLKKNPVFASAFEQAQNLPFHEGSTLKDAGHGLVRWHEEAGKFLVDQHK